MLSPRSMLWPMSMFLGSALGGLTTEKFGATASLLIDALSFIVSAYFISTLPALPADLQHKSSAKVSFSDFLKNGLSTFDRKLSVVQKGIFGIGGAAYFIQSLLGMSLEMGQTGAAGLSATFSARALGALSGAIVAKRFFSNKSEISLIAIGYLISGVAYCVVGFTTGTELYLFGIFAAHFGSILVWVYSTVWIQRTFEQNERGRAAGLDVGLFMLTTSLSTLVCGELITAELISATHAAAICGIFWVMMGVLMGMIKQNKFLTGPKNAEI